MKEFKTIDEQIDKLLEKELIIDDIETTKSILEFENYYNLINGYKELFTCKYSEKEKFIKDTHFNEVYAVYNFDSNIRSIFMKYILKCENYIKSKIIYTFCYNHREKDYLKIENFNNTNDKKIKYINKLINDINLDVERQTVNKKGMLIHYKENYDYIPLWVVSIILTFGKTSKFYELMKNKEQCQISKSFKLFPEHLIRYLNSLTLIRNICAHSERLYNFKYRNRIKDIDIHEKLNITKEKGNYICGTNDLFSIVIILKKLLKNNEFKYFFKELQKEINILKGILSETDMKKLYNNMGFPHNYMNIQYL